MQHGVCNVCSEDFPENVREPSSTFIRERHQHGIATACCLFTTSLMPTMLPRWLMPRRGREDVLDSHASMERVKEEPQIADSTRDARNGPS